MNLIFIFPNLLPSLLSYVPGLTKVQAVDDHLKDRHRILNLLKDNLVQAQSRMKKNADLKRIDKEFSVGDWVYLRLQPYRQTSLALLRAIKLGPRFYGPYQILERVGTVAYRLDYLLLQKSIQFSVFPALSSIWVPLFKLKILSRVWTLIKSLYQVQKEFWKKKLLVVARMNTVSF